MNQYLVSISIYSLFIGISFYFIKSFIPLLLFIYSFRPHIPWYLWPTDNKDKVLFLSQIYTVFSENLSETLVDWPVKGRRSVRDKDIETNR